MERACNASLLELAGTEEAYEGCIDAAREYREGQSSTGYRTSEAKATEASYR